MAVPWTRLKLELCGNCSLKSVEPRLLLSCFFIILACRSCLHGPRWFMARVCFSQYKGSMEEQGSMHPFPFGAWPTSCVYFFCSHPIGQSVLRKAEKSKVKYLGSFIALCHCHGIQMHNSFSSSYFLLHFTKALVLSRSEFYKHFFHPRELCMAQYQFVDVKNQMQSSYLTGKKEVWSRDDPYFLDHQVPI